MADRGTTGAGTATPLTTAVETPEAAPSLCSKEERECWYATPDAALLMMDLRTRLRL